MRIGRLSQQLASSFRNGHSRMPEDGTANDPGLLIRRPATLCFGARSTEVLPRLASLVQVPRCAALVTRMPLSTLLIPLIREGWHRRMGFRSAIQMFCWSLRPHVEELQWLACVSWLPRLGVEGPCTTMYGSMKGNAFYWGV